MISPALAAKGAKLKRAVTSRILNSPGHSLLGELRGRSFWIGVAVAYILSSYLTDQGVFRIAGLAIDRQMISDAARAAEHRVSRPHELDVRLVTLDDEAYPLSASQLARAICAILYQQPAVLVVDVETSRTEYLGLAVLPTVTPIVWGQRALEKLHEGHLSFTPGAVLGSFDLGLRLPEGHSAGIAAMRRELDLSVRRYDRWIEFDEDHRRSIHFEALYRLCRREPDRCTAVPWDEPHVAEARVAEGRYLYRFERRPLEDIVDILPEDEFQRCATVGDFSLKPRPNGAYVGKIVVLGFWDSPYDMHPTVFGDQPGIQIVASAIQHELDDTTLGRVDSIGALAIKLCLAVLVALFHSRLRPLPAMLAVVLLLGALVYWGAYLALRIWGLQASLLPFLLGVHIEQLLSTAERKS